jgi:hypothetical protein
VSVAVLQRDAALLADSAWMCERGALGRVVMGFAAGTRSFVLFASMLAVALVSMRSVRGEVAYS